MEQTARQEEAVQLSHFEQQIYLRYLMAKLEAPQTTHQALTAKAYESILNCLRNDKLAQEQQ